MDRLPVTRMHKTIWLVCMLAWFFDGFEQASPAFMLPFQFQEFHLTAATSALILSAPGWGLLIGSFLFSYLADKLGRRLIFQVDLLIYSVFGGLRVFATGWIDTFVFTSITAIGIAGMYAVDNAYMAEFLPPKDRGKWQGLMTIALIPGYMVASALMLAIPNVPTLAGLPFGWRLIPFLGALPAFLVFWARRTLPESVRFLVSIGKVEEATKIVDKLETSAGPNFKYEGPIVAPTLVRKPKVDPRIFFKKQYIFYTIPLWFSWMPAFFEVSAENFLPTIFMMGLGEGMTGITVTVIISQLSQVSRGVSRVFAAISIDRFGRKWIMILCSTLGALGMAIWAYPWVHRSEVPFLYVIIPVLIATWMNGYFTASYVASTELYPTEARAMAFGWGSTLGRVANIVAPLVMAALLSNMEVFFYTTAAMFIALTIMTWAWIPETKKMSIEVSSKEISQR